MLLNPIEGEIFYIDKPLGLTSFSVVKQLRACLRRKLKTRSIKVGHAGTLDPLASGVLVVVTGRKTKLIETLQGGVKEYVAGLRLGATTPSFDMETQEDATMPWEHITDERIREVLASRFTGKIEQVPPSFSACKVDGKPAYKLARRGEDVAIRPKTLVIDEIELVDSKLPQQPDITIRVLCSKGTYIRALARDIGTALESGAYLTSLRRTRVGDVRVKDCLSLSQVLDMLSDADYVSAEDAEAARLEREREENRARQAAMTSRREARARARESQVK
ncbi:MAG: tRNA pseudouridine(55) synthase TruB [Muribaculaceae bacterium]|nr:tRNA pseudouridine(55) synthase TruB [Muribaculaceae bacterium]